MLALGRAFAKGLGVPQDFIEAHKWLNLAAGRGSADGADERDALAKEMTVGERAEARKLARVWRQAASRPASPTAPARKVATPKKPAPAGPPPKRALREAQGLLARLGYTPGPADGVWRPESAKAYRTFLGKAGMTPGEVLTPAGLRALRRAAKDGAAAARSAGGNLHRAVQAGDIDGLKAALKAGADANARDRRGWTALMHAANKGHTLMVGPLLAAKADPDVRAADGATALFMAAAHGHTEIVVQLMKAGADIAVKGPGGRTPVDVARLRYGKVATARKKGADPALLALLNGRTLAQIAAKAQAAKAAAKAAAAKAAAKAAAARARAAAAERAKAAKIAAEETAMRLTPADRRAIQSDLALLGYDPGPVDGTFGPATRAALRSWQKAKGLKATGWINPPAAGVLRAEAARAKIERAKKAEQERFARQWPAGKQIRDCAECPQMVVIPAGSFTMGGYHEGPQHAVTIRRPFAVGKYEVTFAEWDACVAAGGCGNHQPGDSLWGRGKRPAIYVSWRDARSYVRWLSQRTGRAYRLLSEAEWEYSARSRAQTAYAWGAFEDRNRANCKGCGSRWDGRKTARIGTFPANGFGLYDMHGNVREWVEDCWHGSYRGAPTDGSAWTVDGNCGRRVLRGGSWRDDPARIRAAARINGKVKARNSKTGFRVALTLVP